ncbi:hypothetical protein TNCV_2449981 [Trichonephila clavipes]|uniref:Uncharacterized protein n=1 Tax=Trichonephila clavipes TaxID=2585209 RepID=A0A8X6UWB2_TRICX|nr:hypothetical protein TNCV_2449981 [Trichonephila clavipes]
MRVKISNCIKKRARKTRAERNEVRRLEQQQSRRFAVNRRRTNDQQRQQAHRQRARCSFERAQRVVEYSNTYAQLQSDNYAIVGNPDKTPAGEHIRRFNARS